MELVGQGVPRGSLREVAKVFHTLCWRFPDNGVEMYFLVDDDGGVSSATDWTGSVDGVITLDAAVFHAAAFGKANLATAMLMGKLRISGISVLHLGKFAPLLKPFQSSYRQAWTEVNEPAA
ncbi:MAG: SCP2 sterol-binding domain-containing protein [Dehalococcoidia bacterium]|nr:SCP2 sterol-binding domain-containing protein [Dehalococcoidia bacterium]